MKLCKGFWRRFEGDYFFNFGETRKRFLHGVARVCAKIAINFVSSRKYIAENAALSIRHIEVGYLAVELVADKLIVNLFGTLICKKFACGENFFFIIIKELRIQDKARNVGFDWEERSQVWTKVKEEIGEFEAEVENMDKEKAEAEFGDVMFSLINAARLYKINPDNALELTNQKFIRRFNYLEEHTIKQGKNLKDMTLEEMDAIWNEAKKEEK